MASKFYSIIFPVIEASTGIMKDHGILRGPFSVSELKHKHGKNMVSLSLLAII